MGHDDTQPKNRIIFISTALSALTLAILGPMFGAYFSSYLEREVAEKVLTVPNAQYQETKASALSQLNDGPMPIARAVAVVGSQGRDASKAIEPEQSDDVGAVEGWMLSKNEAAAAAATRAVERRKAAEEARRLAEGGEASPEAADGETPGADGAASDTTAADPSTTDTTASAAVADDAPFGAEGGT